MSDNIKAELDPRERDEILAVITSVQPLIDAYHRGDLSEEEKEFLLAVVQSVWPTVQAFIANIWEKLEPILISIGRWPVPDDSG